MIHIQSFNDKIEELKKAEETASKLKIELRNDATEMKKLIVEILDDILDTSKISRISLKIKLNTNNKNFYKIEHNRPKDDDISSLTTHFGGIDTLIFYKDNNNKDHFDLLWNFMAGGDSLFQEISYILEYMMEKYNKNYKNVTIKQSANKYNL